MKFLVLQHIPIEHPGIFRDFMMRDNIEIHTVELDEGESIPDLKSYDAMIVMGGPMDTWQEEEYSWLKPEKESIYGFTCIQKKPYLGLCLGAQLLGEVIGGEVKKMEINNQIQITYDMKNRIKRYYVDNNILSMFPKKNIQYDINYSVNDSSQCELIEVKSLHNIYLINKCHKTE